MRLNQPGIGYILLGANVLLLFLAIFSNQVVLPDFLHWIGRFHPVLMHLPIGMTLLVFLLWIFRKSSEDTMLTGSFYPSLLGLTALSAAGTAILGLFLSRGQDYEAVLLAQHLWGGVGLSFFSWLSYHAFTEWPRWKTWWTPIQVSGLSLLLFTGHMGGSLTHGSDYLAWPRQSEPVAKGPVDGSATYFQVAIRPVLEKKCVACHNRNKAKGDLILASLPARSGQVWEQEKPGGDWLRELAVRIDLPVTDKKHMPPRGKNPLEPNEIERLRHWVAAGGNVHESLDAIGKSHPLYADRQRLVTAGKETKVYAFSPLSESRVSKLSDAFTVVQPLASGSPALRADFFIGTSFEVAKLDRLAAAREQLVSLNLGRMPLGDGDLNRLSVFRRLEKLSLNQTRITDMGIPRLKQLPKLEVLSLSGTAITTAAIPVLASFPALREVFLWNTAITEREFRVISRKYKKITWHFGFTPNPAELLPLTGPVTENKTLVLSANDSIRLKKPIPGAEIRYTLDGSVPDSLHSLLYRGPIGFSGSVTLTARTFKQGWKSSPSYTYAFFREGIRPDSARLLSNPEPEYAGAGAESLSDRLLGKPDQFRAGNWLGYRRNPMEVLFRFSPRDAGKVRRIAVHYGMNVGSYILAPASLELWAGEEEKNLKLRSKISLPPLTKENLGEVSSKVVNLDLKGSGATFYRIVVKNVTKLPSFHEGKGDLGWVFVDEIFFYP